MVNIRLLAKIFVFNDQGEILLMQRSRHDDRRPLEWDLPGGNVEQNEDPNEAMLRELEEEAGLTALNPQVIYVASQTEPQYVVTLVYRGTADRTDVRLSHEHEQYRWIKPEAITDFKMPQKYLDAAGKLQ